MKKGADRPASQHKFQNTVALKLVSRGGRPPGGGANTSWNYCP